MAEGLEGGLHGGDVSHARHRVTVAEAADILGITAEAVRTRIKRGRLDSVKEPPGPGGTVYVLLQADQPRPNYDPTSRGQDRTDDQTPPTAVVVAKDETIESLRERVRRLEHELDIRNDEIRRRDHLLAAALERIPAIEAPPEEQESPQSGEPQSGETTPTEPAEGSQEATQERISWVALFFNLLAAAVVIGFLYLAVRVGLVTQSDFPTLVVGIIGVVGALGAAWLTVYLTGRARRRS